MKSCTNFRSGGRRLVVIPLSDTLLGLEVQSYEPVPGRQRQGDHLKFESILTYSASSRPTVALQETLSLETESSNNKTLLLCDKARDS